MTVRFATEISEHINLGFLTSELQTSLRQTVFSSGLMVSPRRINSISQTITDSFAAFLVDGSSEKSQDLGRSLALEGLGPRSVLSTTEGLRRVCLKSSNGAVDLSEIAGSFVNALLEGYMQGREERLLEIQERTHRAHLAALARQQEEPGRPG